MSVNLCVDENDYLLVKQEFPGTELCPAKLGASESPVGKMHPKVRHLLSEMIDGNRKVNQRMKELVENIDYQPAKEIIQYAVRLPNTRDRANCMRWSLQCLEKDVGPTNISLSSSIELIHLATLLADEIFDETETCGMEDGGEPPKKVNSTWKEFYKDQAFSAAEVLVSLAIENVTEICKSGDTFDKICPIIERLSKTIKENYLGQIMDLTLLRQEKASTVEYFQMISTLEGKPLQLAIETGVFYAGGSEQKIRTLGECGYLLGTMFKLRNDIIDIIGDKKALGKEIAEDITIRTEGGQLKLILKETKKTLPIIYLIERIPSQGTLQLPNGASVQHGGAIAGVRDVADAKKAIIAYLKHDAVAKCKEELKSLGARVLAMLDTLKRTQGRTQLETLTKFVSERFSLKE